MQQYAFNGLAGCVTQRTSRETGGLVGLYNAQQAAFCGEGGPWVTVCEKHSTLANHPTLSLARKHLTNPLGWCEECRRETSVGADATALAVERFPILFAAAEQSRRFIAALAEIAAGVETGSIRNVVYESAKSALSNAVEDAWRKHVSEPYFHAGRYAHQLSDVRALNDSIVFMGMHSVVPTHRKLERTKATGPAVDAMRAFIDEVLPLATAMASLKGRIVKGRAPGTGPAKPVNPNKVVKTCPCCLRKIAVVSDKMAHHGYKRPGHGHQTSSCHGIRFKPLEVSTEGLVWMITLVTGELESARRRLADRENWTSLSVPWSRKFETVTKDSPNWQRIFEYTVSSLQSQIRSATRELKMRNDILKNWKPEAAEVATA